MYTEASSNYPGVTLSLESPDLPTIDSGLLLSFYYVSWDACACKKAKGRLGAVEPVARGCMSLAVATSILPLVLPSPLLVTLPFVLTSRQHMKETQGSSYNLGEFRVDTTSDGSTWTEGTWSKSGNQGEDWQQALVTLPDGTRVVAQRATQTHARTRCPLRAPTPAPLRALLPTLRTPPVPSHQARSASVSLVSSARARTVTWRSTTSNSRMGLRHRPPSARSLRCRPSCRMSATSRCVPDSDRRHGNCPTAVIASFFATAPPLLHVLLQLLLRCQRTRHDR